MEQVITCGNFASSLTNLLQSKYANSKVLLVTNQFLLQKFNKKLNELKKCAERIEFLALPNFACNNKLFTKTLTNQVSEDVCLLVVFGAGNLCDLVKQVSLQKCLPYIIVPSACSGGGYGLITCSNFYQKHVTINTVNLPQNIIVDQDVVAQTPNQMVASCLGECVSYLLFLLDAVYLKASSSSTINAQKLLMLEQLVHKVLSTPTNIFKTPFGKVELLKSVLTCQELLNELNLTNTSIQSFNNLLLTFVKKQISYGASAMVSSLVLINFLKQFFASKMLNCNGFPNIERRVNKLKSILNDKQCCFLYELNFDQTKLVNKVFSMKQIGIKLTTTYQKSIQNAFVVFKNLHNDKAVFLNKIISKGAVVNALCMAPDVYLGQNLLTVTRNLGLLELNV